MFRPRSILIIFLLSFCTAGGQAPAFDSLKYQLAAAAADQEKMAVILEITELGMSADSLLPYIEMAEQIARKTGQKRDEDLSAYCRAGFYIRNNRTDSALVITNRLIEDYKFQKNQQPFYLKLIFFKAKILDRSNQYSKALSQLIEVIQTAETLQDTLIQIQAKTGIGWVQMEMEQYKEALQWLHKALRTSSNPAFYRNYGALYSNLATTYNEIGRHDSARYYINIAIQDARAYHNDLFLATALSMQAKIFIDAGTPALAEAPLHEVIEIRKKLDDQFYTVFDMSNLASYYASNHQPGKGIALCNEGIQIAKKLGLSSQLLMIYKSLAENYKAAGQNKEYGETLEYILELKDSFNTINTSKQLAEWQSAIESQKKEQQIIQQKLSLTQKNYLFYGTLLITVMLIVISVLGFLNYRRRQAMKTQLAMAEQKRMAQAAVANAEEQERKRIAADLHDNLGAYAASIASNIDHLSLHSSGGAAVMPLQELRLNAQAIVSQLADTIWALKKDALSLTALSDRIKVFIQRLQPSYPSVLFDVIENFETDHLLQPSQAFHLFQTVQEAMINALKHSGANRISIFVTGTGAWQIRVEDNGRGMTSTSSRPGGGNGLANMKNRAREGGWTIAWKPLEEGGTTVMITPTTN